MQVLIRNCYCNKRLNAYWFALYRIHLYQNEVVVALAIILKAPRRLKNPRPKLEHPAASTSALAPQCRFSRHWVPLLLSAPCSPKVIDAGMTLATLTIKAASLGGELHLALSHPFDRRLIQPTLTSNDHIICRVAEIFTGDYCCCCCRVFHGIFIFFFLGTFMSGSSHGHFWIVFWMGDSESPRVCWFSFFLKEGYGQKVRRLDL